MTDFICRRCGKCCGLVPFTRAEYKTIRKSAEKMGITLVKQYINGKPAYLPRQLARKLELPPEKIAELVELDCPFLGKDKDGKALCRIYDLRPGICRLFGNNPEQHPLLKCLVQEQGHV